MRMTLCFSRVSCWTCTTRSVALLASFLTLCVPRLLSVDTVCRLPTDFAVMELMWVVLCGMLISVGCYGEHYIH